MHSTTVCKSGLAFLRRVGISYLLPHPSVRLTVTWPAHL